MEKRAARHSMDQAVMQCYAAMAALDAAEAELELCAAQRWIEQADEHCRAAEAVEQTLAAAPRNDAATAQAETLQRWKVAAKQGQAEAQFSLGNCYQTGEGGVMQNLQESAWLWRLAANQNHALAQRNLGIAYAHGQERCAERLGRGAPALEAGGRAGPVRRASRQPHGTRVQE
mmetsp:Transcript_45045/g.111623  ORF Transcript_45045/g.111623 Transcript_45045/m.111623 type:complete len:174 (+) Transcript_45045:466-987(+)